MRWKAEWGYLERRRRRVLDGLWKGDPKSREDL